MTRNGSSPCPLATDWIGVRPRPQVCAGAAARSTIHSRTRRLCTATDVTIDIPTSPSGPLSCSGQTSSTGRLGCALDNPPDGLYESLVSDVSAAGFNNWTGSECGGVGQPPCGCSIEIGGGGGNDCGNGTCDAGESCDGRNGTVSCPADCAGKTNGKPSTRYCYVGGNCEGPGCP